MSDLETAPTTAPENTPPVSSEQTLYPPEPEVKPVETPEGNEVQVTETEEPPPPEGGDEEESISSFDELIEHFESANPEGEKLDRDWLMSLKVPVKVDGQPADATLSDLVKSYQIGEAAEKRLKEANAKRDAQTKELTDKAQALDSHFAVAAELIKSAESFLDHDVKSIDWAKLREEDPAEYSAKKSEVAERRASLDEMKKKAVETYQTSTAERRQQLMQELDSRVPQERAALLEAFPDWKDEPTFKAEMRKDVDYLKGIGVTDQELGNMAFDHRYWVLADKARRFDEAQSKTSAVKKKVARVPKVMKPGAKADQSKPRPRDPAEILYGAS